MNNIHETTVAKTNETKKTPRKSGKYYREITDNFSDIIIITDEAGNIKYCSNSIERYGGYKPREMVGKSAFSFFHPDDIDRAFEDYCNSLLADENTLIPNEFRVIHKNGSVVYLDGIGRNLLHNPDIRGFVMNVRDVTEKKLAEEELKKSEARYKLIAEHVKDYVWILDLNLKPTYVSPSVAKATGYSSAELEASSLDKILTNTSYQKAMDLFTEEMSKAKLNPPPPDYKRSLEVQLRCKDGRIILVEATLSFIQDEKGKPLSILGEGREITDRRNMEEKIIKSEERYKLIAEHVKDYVCVFDLNLKPTYVSPSVEKDSGYTFVEIQKTSLDKFFTKSSFQKVTEMFSQEMSRIELNPPDHDYKGSLEVQLRNKDGRLLWVESTFSFLHDEEGNMVSILAEGRDITERRKAEEKYRLLADNITEHVWLMDLKSLKMTYVSPSVEKMYGYTVNEIKKLSLRKILTEESYKKVEERFLEEAPKAAATMPPAIHKYSLELQARHKDGHLLWTENTLSFIRDERGILSQMLGETRDITKRKQVEEKLQQTLNNLRKSFAVTIQVLTAAIEMRDPYTAGHQTRVADIAAAIALEMGLSDDQIEGLHMAGSIHDIGKITVPSELLTKPTKLSDIEFSLIREHSQRGYEMLKNIESPWPLATIIQQHHERMDGSGYPKKLKGDEILLEARILAVADLVEAMASHRPYRPSRGLDKALEEIETNKGILYDDAVVDACLRLFREKGYKLK